ncbi:hypothetical protein MAPG_07125 [Magnaporthiopsis poae ATCC 64411]|uniref:Uncharacterized protein n=1 Tax=Magnaporthiopsis poae (strain ATCC 64411 / 73-15) TaxID=644358 RepID=A0A0C4E3V0_MAGP6|nr:hypothetical protein MAPG_07125 [Magnaporthiopsis poae ATCC 64411]
MRALRGGCKLSQAEPARSLNNRHIPNPCQLVPRAPLSIPVVPSAVSTGRNGAAIGKSCPAIKTNRPAQAASKPAWAAQLAPPRRQSTAIHRAGVASGRGPEKRPVVKSSDIVIVPFRSA